MKTIPKLMNNALFGKATENVTKHTNIRLETTERRKIILHQNRIIILQSFLQKIC